MFRSIDYLIRQAQTWDEFVAIANDLPSKAPGLTPDKGKIFERLTQLFLQSSPRYRTKLRHVWRVQDELSYGHKVRLQLPSTDEGIDLVAETVEGHFWSIQCKYRSNQAQALTVSDLATFANLSFTVCKGFATALVVHTSSKPVKKHRLLGGLTEVGLADWLALSEEDWSAIHQCIAGIPSPPQPRDPRPHQRAAIGAALTHFGSNERGRLIMPCGTGKSLTAFWIAQQMGARSILVAVPSLSLIKQSITDWTREFLAHGETPEWLCACSDETAGRVERDEFVEGTYDLGIEVSTKPDEIAEFLRRPTTNRKIVFSTYQSGKMLSSGARMAEASFDLGIMDEAHRTVGHQSKSFSHLLFDENVSIKRRLFMTATERVVRGADDEVLSMDNEDVYGQCFHSLSFKAAIHTDPPIISDYRVVTMAISDQRIAELVEENRFLHLMGTALNEQEAQSLAAAVALRRAYADYGVKHAISFHRSIKAAEDFMELQNELGSLDKQVGPLQTFHVSSRKSSGDRAQVIQAYRDSQLALITNARCLQEGVDIPAVDCVLFADPKQSVVDIVQAAGRAMRPFKGKEFGYIIIPIIVPSDKSFDEFAESTEFKQVARTVAALSTQDDRIAEEFRAVDRGKSRSGRIVDFVGDIPVGLQINAAEFIGKVEARIWDRVGRANWRSFEEAREWAQLLGLKGVKDWVALSKLGHLPADIPTKPERIYKGKGWLSWGDWLGTGVVSVHRREYRCFEEARDWVRSLGLKGKEDWDALSKLRRLPPYIPANPGRVYKDSGWVSFGDWLGTDYIATRLREYRPFEEARDWVRSLGLKSAKDWSVFTKSGKLPADIPVAADRVYAGSGWVSLGDWLGTDSVATYHRQYRSFEEARDWVRSLGLRGRADWDALSKSGRLPKDIPSRPERVYREKGWINLGDWLGSGFVAYFLRKYRPFKEAREWARSLGIKTRKDWLDYAKSGHLPTDIPIKPDNTYKDSGWAGIGDWLGSGSVATHLRQYRCFEEARDWVRSLGLKGGKDWHELKASGELPPDIPTMPNKVYKDKGWVNWGDWFGTGVIAPHLREFRSFMEARDWVRLLGLTGTEDWHTFIKSGKLPPDIPTNPQRTYKENGWVNFGDWLGTDSVATYHRQYRSFEEARDWVRSLGLTVTEDWHTFIRSGKLPPDIPLTPNHVYKNSGWVSMGDWLGTGNIANFLREFRSFEEARDWVRSLGLKNVKDWLVFAKSGELPVDIPTNPQRTYKENGWVNWGDWLGAGKNSNRLKQ